jgi:hypothetical protein
MQLEQGVLVTKLETFQHGEVFVLMTMVIVAGQLVPATTMKSVLMEHILLMTVMTVQMDSHVTVTGELAMAEPGSVQMTLVTAAMMTMR